MNEVSSSSFEFYEGLRILVPGGLAVGLYAAVAETFGVGGSVTVGDALIAVLASFAVGFVLLFLDAPGKAAVFLFEAPEPFLRSWNDVKPAHKASYLNVYFELLDAEFPPGIRNRIYYQGAIYRIGFESIYLAASAIPVLALCLLFPFVGIERGGTGASALRWLFGVALVTHAVVVAMTVWSRAGQHRRRMQPTPRRPTRANWLLVRRDLSREIPTLDRLFIAVGVAALLAHLAFGWRWAGVAGIALPGLTWAYRYFRGVPRDPDAIDRRTRQNLHAVSASVIYGVSAMSLCLIGLRYPTSNSPLDAGVVTGWLAGTLVTAALIAARGHERKLLGSYATQRVWLTRHKEDVLVGKGYFLKTTGTSARP